MNVEDVHVHLRVKRLYEVWIGAAGEFPVPYARTGASVCSVSVPLYLTDMVMQTRKL